MSEDLSPQPGTASQTGLPALVGQAGTPSIQISNPAATFTTARAMILAGQQEEGRLLLKELTIAAPAFEAAWLQLLALEPPPSEEIDLLQGFLLHHPQHRFAEAFRARLHDMRLIAMLSEGSRKPTDQPGQTAPSLRLGDYLIRKKWVSQEQVEQALDEQRRLREAGIEQRLGTVLLMLGHLHQDQLAFALAMSLGSHQYGEFGNYLVRTGVLSPAQVAEALVRQDMIRADLDKTYLQELATYRSELARSKPTFPYFGKRPPRPAEPQRKPVPKLGEVLVSMGLLTTPQVAQILEDRRRTYNSQFE